MKRQARAIWEGTGMEGKGTFSTKSGAIENMPYSFKARFENEDNQLGTNPEELIAAAHASCFGMALSFQLSNAGLTPERLDTEAVLEMAKGDAGWRVTKITLNLDAIVPGASVAQFEELANNAKEGCPISNVLNCEIELNASLAVSA